MSTIQRAIPKAKFSDLPLDIRSRILFEGFDFLTSKIVNLGYRARWTSPYGTDDPQCFHLFYWKGDRKTHEWLTTCRAFTEVVSPYIYSHNMFLIRYRDLNSLYPIWAMSDATVSSLRHLNIRLNVTTCDLDGGCELYNPNRPLPASFDRNADWPVGRSTPHDRALINEWKRAAATLARNLQPGKVRFRLTCDVEDYDTAEEIVAPLLKRFPKLLSCSIRLHALPVPEIQRLAHRTAYLLTSERNPDGTKRAENNRFDAPFRFGDLPNELKLQVLSHTDLVVPCEMEWIPGKPWRMKKDYFNCYEPWYGCSCRRVHGAYGPRCKCFMSPSPLFLVDRATYELARAVFFSKNRFIVVPTVDKYNDGPTAPPATLSALVFLRDIVRTSNVGSLKHLEIMFPPLEGDYMPPGSAVWRDWEAILDILVEYANLPKLTLIIHFLNIRAGFSHMFPPEHPIPAPEMYNRMRDSLVSRFCVPSLLGSRSASRSLLGKFWIYMVWPFEERLDSDDEVMERVQSLEHAFESRVMADRTYDAYEHGKWGRDLSNNVQDWLSIDPDDELDDDRDLP